MSDWSLDLGGVLVRGIAEEERFAVPRGVIFPASRPDLLARAAALDPAACDAAADLVLLRIQVFLIEAFGRTVLVDAGIGDDKERLARPAWHRRRSGFLARLGVPPEAVERVVFTHLHADHVGWGTRWSGERWVPSFPRARHLVTATELRHWAAQHAEGPVNHGAFGDSVLPLLEAGLIDEVEADHAPLPGLRLRPLPGHTPGQVGVLLEGRAGRALIAADSVHHPIQLLDAGLVSAFCEDPVQAVATRAALFAEAVEDGLPLIAHHACGTPVWRLRRDGAGYTL